MGAVYRARDEKLDRDVALKVIHDQHAADAEFRRRLLQEAKAAAAVAHAAVPTIYEVGEDGEKLYIAMALLSGGPLRDAIGTLTLEQALSIGADVASALQKAHDAGIVHRDIKPENIFLCDDGTTMVLDFGIARRSVDPSAPTGVQDALASREGSVIGTLGYMSPEQALGETVGPPSDVFSLGVVLYEMIAGTRPFQGKSLMEAAIAATRDEPTPLGEHVSVPKGVAALVHQCLSKKPGERPFSAGALAAQLRSLAGDVAGMGEADTSVLAPLGTPPVSTKRKAPPVTRWWPLGVGGATLALVGWLAAGAIHSDPAPSPSASLSAEAPPPVATAITALPIVGTESSEARAAYEQALAAFRRADWHHAHEHLLVAAAKDPEFALAQLRLGIWEGFNGQPADARKRFKWLAEREAQLDERHRAYLRALEAVVVQEPSDYALSATRLTEAIQKWPLDAELHFVLASARERTVQLDEATAEAKKAVELDPEYADALQALGRIALKRGNTHEAGRFFDRCVTARGLDCLHDRLRLSARTRKCADVIRDAKLYEEGSGGGRSLHWVYAASAVLSMPSEPRAAAEQFLARADAAAKSGPPASAARLARLRLLALDGKLEELIAKVDEVYPQLTTLREMADVTYLSAMAARELGKDAEVRRVAERYLAARHAAMSDALQQVASDPAPLLWQALHAKSNPQELESKLVEWRDTQRKLGFAEGPIWFQSQAALADDEKSARAAMAAKPADFIVEQVQEAALGWDVLARVERLGGEPNPNNLTAARGALSCTDLIYPFAHVGADMEVAQTAEVLGDSKAACGSYAYVVYRWGAAKPLPATARRAQERMRKLHCEPQSFVDGYLRYYRPQL